MLRKPVPPNLLYNIIQQYFLKTLQVPVTEEYGDQNQIFVCVCVCVWSWHSDMLSKYVHSK